MTTNIDASKHEAYHSPHIKPADLEGAPRTAKIVDVFETEAWNEKARRKEIRLALRLEGWPWYFLLNKTSNAFLCATFGKMTGAWVGRMIVMTAGKHTSGKDTIFLSALKQAQPATKTAAPKAPKAPVAPRVNTETGEITEADDDKPSGIKVHSYSEMTARLPAISCDIRTDEWGAALADLCATEEYWEKRGVHAVNVLAKIGYGAVESDNLLQAISDLRVYGTGRLAEIKAAKN